MASAIDDPQLLGTVWRASTPDVEVRFVGRAVDGDRAATLAAVCVAGGESISAPSRLGWLTQVHSATVVEARAGNCGAADALWTDADGMALAIATADCVPVLLAGVGRVAAVHAGWRGLVAGIVPRAVRALGGDRGGIRAWIGPAIGPCCYEVGEDVAAAIAEASGAGSIVRRSSDLPHADLVAAASRQLERAGVLTISALAVCTRCNPGLLWSYRRDGTSAGRNLAFIWRTGGAVSEA